MCNSLTVNWTAVFGSCNIYYGPTSHWGRAFWSLMRNYACELLLCNTKHSRFTLLTSKKSIFSVGSKLYYWHTTERQPLNKPRNKIRYVWATWSHVHTCTEFNAGAQPTDTPSSVFGKRNYRAELTTYSIQCRDLAPPAMPPHDQEQIALPGVDEVPKSGI